MTYEQTVSNTITNTIGMNFVIIPAGTFMMGSPNNEPSRYDDETHHQVTISKSFFMQTTQTTQGQWKKVTGKNPSRLTNWFLIHDDYPVRNVTWDDVQQFIQKLNKMERTDKYRLPTEAEWEYACRAGTTTMFHTTGNTAKDLSRVGWWAMNAGSKAHRVGKKPPNAWGLYDMHGNVWEMVQDWYGDYPSGGVTDPAGPSSGSYRVRRGGSYMSSGEDCRSATRGSSMRTLAKLSRRFDQYINGPGARNDYLGFRLLMTL